MFDSLLIPWTPWPSQSWLQMSPLEIAATVFGFWSVLAYVGESLWAWPTGLLNVALYIALFWKCRLYGDTALQVVYVVLQLYGWWQWRYGGSDRHELPISRTSLRLWGLLIALMIAIYVPVAVLLGRFTDTDVPWWDSAPTILSLTAQWMISRKKLENWWIWILTDLIYIPLYLYKHLYLTSALYGVFMILCIVGLRRWTLTYRSIRAA